MNAFEMKKGGETKVGWKHGRHGIHGTWHMGWVRLVATGDTVPFEKSKGF